MKKISINDLDSLGMERLSREHLKKVVGGTGIQCGVEAGGALCPNGLCCSQYGFCGSTEAYCGEGCQSQCDDSIPICYTGTKCRLHILGPNVTVDGTCSTGSGYEPCGCAAIYNGTTYRSNPDAPTVCLSN